MALLERIVSVFNEKLERMDARTDATCSDEEEGEGGSRGTGLSCGRGGGVTQTCGDMSCQRYTVKTQV